MAQQLMDRSELDNVHHLFGKHISKGQLRYLRCAHLDTLERKGVRFKDAGSGRMYYDAFTATDVCVSAMKLTIAATGRNKIIAMVRAYNGYEGFNLSGNGKDNDPEHSWPDQLNHQKSELRACCLAMYVNCTLPGQM